MFLQVPVETEQEVEILLKSDTISESVRGFLTVPYNAKGIVIFAHGSGSGRHSPRNQYVAKTLNESGLATVLADLLTKEEGIEDEKTRKIRFDIELLTERLITITQWVQENKQTQDMQIGYFGASTGAAACLRAAAHFENLIKAIVSRGGRVDLAGSSSIKKQSSAIGILFLVGSNDPQTIKLNQKVLEQLNQVDNKRMVLVQGAGHLFEEEGKLEEVAKHSASWFKKSFQ